MNRADLESTQECQAVVEVPVKTFTETEIIDRWNAIRNFDDSQYVEDAKKENYPLECSGKIYDNRLAR